MESGHLSVQGVQVSHSLGHVDGELEAACGVDHEARALVEDLVERAHGHELRDHDQVGRGVAAPDHRHHVRVGEDSVEETTEREIKM